MEDVRCKKCNKLLFRKGKRIIDVTGIDEEIKKQIHINADREIEILCRNKTKEGFCKTINIVKV